MEKLRGFSIAMIILALVAFGCATNDDDDNGNPMDDDSGHPPAEMVGSWMFVSVTVDGNAASLADVQEWLASTVESRVHIEENGAYVFEEVNSSGAQLWFELGFIVIDGTELDVNATSDSDGPANETTRAAFTVSDTEMTLEFNIQGEVIVYSLSKR